jgi:hypothetical protein
VPFETIAGNTERGFSRPPDRREIEDKSLESSIGLLLELLDRIRQILGVRSANWLLRPSPLLFRLSPDFTM